MFGGKFTRRRVLLCSGSVAMLAGLLLCMMHTGVVRRFALIRVQVLLGKTLGVVLDAGELDYNLFRSHYELKDVILRGKHLADLPAPVRAQRVTVDASLRDLARGSFDRARIQIDGLSVHVVTDATGRRNLPSFGDGSGCATPKGPTISVTSAEVFVEDKPSGLSVHLPLVPARPIGTVPALATVLASRLPGGRLDWRDLRLPIDHLKLKSALTGCGFSIESLRIASGDSLSEVAGDIKGSPASIRATGIFDMDSRNVGQALSLKSQLAGRLQAQLRANGPIDGFQLDADLSLRSLAIGKILVQRPVLSAAFDTGTGELRIRSLTADLFAGRLRATGTLSTSENHGRSDVKVMLAGVDPRRIAEVLGTLGLPPRPAELQLTASCAGLDWRHAKASGTIRSASAKIRFDTMLNENRVRALLDTSLGDNARLQGDVTVHLDNQAVAGTFNGSIASLAQLGSQLEDVLDRPAGTARSPDWMDLRVGLRP